MADTARKVASAGALFCPGKHSKFVFHPCQVGAVWKSSSEFRHTFVEDKDGPRWRGISQFSFDGSRCIGLKNILLNADFFGLYLRQPIYWVQGGCFLQEFRLNKVCPLLLGYKRRGGHPCRPISPRVQYIQYLDAGINSRSENRDGGPRFLSEHADAVHVEIAA